SHRLHGRREVGGRQTVGAAARALLRGDRRHDRRSRGAPDPRDLPRGGRGALPPARSRRAGRPPAHDGRRARDARRSPAPRMPHAFKLRLDAGPLLCDGAMGTMLYARGVSLDACFDVLNLNNPRLVQAIHADYIAAGADLIETNTFGANRFKLALHGLAGQVREINGRGVRVARDAREATGRDVLVLGSIGPLGKYLAPLGSVTAEEARAAFREQAEGLLEGGVDAFIVETISDLAEIAHAIEAIRSITDLPVIAQMAFTDGA